MTSPDMNVDGTDPRTYGEPSKMAHETAPVQARKCCVDLAELEVALAVLKKINALPFQEITWTRCGKALELTEAQHQARADWRYVGLNNVTFAECILLDKEAL